MCPGDCVQGYCSVCGDCSSSFAAEAPPEQFAYWADLIALIWLR
jgi:hypothetical protein